MTDDSENDDLTVADVQIAAVGDDARAALEQQAALEAAEEAQKQAEKEGGQLAFELLLVNGLYASVPITGAVGEVVENRLRYGEFRFDEYCNSCKRETTFRVGRAEVDRRSYSRPNIIVTQPKLLSINAVCQRDYAVYSFLLKFDDEIVTKIGQDPSMADLAFGELREIDRSLDKVDRQELGKALGLHAHDTAIGAFVYLRRVFERMVQRAHERQSATGHPVQGFDGMRMDERIAALNDELPKKVVQNSAVFSVLSLGLHELTEEQCIKFFPVLKAVLFQMLEQEEHKRKAMATARETELALQQILSDIGGAAKTSGT